MIKKLMEILKIDIKNCIVGVKEMKRISLWNLHTEKRYSQKLIQKEISFGREFCIYNDEWIERKRVVVYHKQRWEVINGND